MSLPWLSCVVGSEPARSNSTSTSVISPSIRSRASRPMRSAAAQCELDGPRITGPMTSLKMETQFMGARHRTLGAAVPIGFDPGQEWWPGRPDARSETGVRPPSPVARL